VKRNGLLDSEDVHTEYKGDTRENIGILTAPLPVPDGRGGTEVEILLP
jgi:hypothetical protein